ncbi:hypothetical protein GCM10027072_77500 [Streptomyces bullii]
MVVGGKCLGIEDSQAVRPVGGRSTVRKVQRAAGGGAQRQVGGEVAELVVPDAGGCTEAGRSGLVAGAALVVGVGGAGAEDEVAAGLGIGGEPVERSVVREVEAGDDEDGMALRRLLGGGTGPLAAWVVELAGVEDARLAPGASKAPR